MRALWRALVVAMLCVTPLGAPDSRLAQSATFARAAPDIPPMLYGFLDHTAPHPFDPPNATTLGPTGSMGSFRWEDVNPAPGVFDWSAIEDEIAPERALTVTLRSGEVISRPLVLQVFAHLHALPGWEEAYFYDATPQWVYERIDAENPADPRPTIGGRKVGYLLASGDARAVLPVYDHATWQAAYWDLVAAFGARYNDDPQVASVVINTGLDGETQPIKTWRDVDWNAVLSSSVGPQVGWSFSNFALATMDAYHAAFPDVALFINNAPGGSGMRRSTSEHAAALDPPVGLKHSGMWTDIDIHEGSGTFVGSWDMVRAYSMTLPIWVESAYGFGDAGHDYWSLLAGLHYHPDAIDLHPAYFETVDPEVLRWVGDRVGRTVDEAPSVWTALRDTEYPPVSWGSGGASGHIGDWTYWLYRVDGEGGRTVRIWREDLPVEARDAIYARQARRTDQGTSQQVIYLDVDDDWPHAAASPEAWHGPAPDLTLRVVFLNQGDDALGVHYRQASGRAALITLNKGAGLGPTNEWVDRTVTLPEARLDNGLLTSGARGYDLRIDCMGDGDEVVHLVELMPAEAPTPAPTVPPGRPLFLPLVLS